jgi:hypothetical protein
MCWLLIGMCAQDCCLGQPVGNMLQLAICATPCTAALWAAPRQAHMCTGLHALLLQLTSASHWARTCTAHPMLDDSTHTGSGHYPWVHPPSWICASACQRCLSLSDAHTSTFINPALPHTCLPANYQQLPTAGSAPGTTTDPPAGPRGVTDAQPGSALFTEHSAAAPAAARLQEIVW